MLTSFNLSIEINPISISIISYLNNNLNVILGFIV